MTDRHISKFDRKRIAKTLGVSPDSPWLRKIDSATRRFWDDYDANESKYTDIELIQRRSGKDALKLERRHYGIRRRPPEVAMRRYITTVVAIHKAATGRAITRIVYSGSHPCIGRQKRHPFLVACLNAAGIHAYPTGLVRQVLEEK